MTIYIAMFVFFVVGILFGLLSFYYGVKLGKNLLVKTLIKDLTDSEFNDVLIDQSEEQTIKGTKKDAFLKGANFVILNLIDGDLKDDIKEKMND